MVNFANHPPRDRDEGRQAIQVHNLGSGVLNWNKSERQSDRYGTVKLSSNPDEVDTVSLSQSAAGRFGTLVAEVLEARESYHFGDLTLDLKPSRPEVGERIKLGDGTLFFESDGSVGVRPATSRDIHWMDSKGLYRAHFQTVKLVFEERDDGAITSAFNC